jgi:hypothetical protein
MHLLSDANIFSKKWDEPGQYGEELPFCHIDDAPTEHARKEGGDIALAENIPVSKGIPRAKSRRSTKSRISLL